FNNGSLEVWRLADGVRMSSALIRRDDNGTNNPLPVVTSDGAFILTAGGPTGDTEIRGAQDGRVLTRIEGVPLIPWPAPDGRLVGMSEEPRGLGHDRYALLGMRAEIITLEVDRRSAAEVHAFVAREIPWRVDDHGQLVPLMGTIAGTARRSGAPI